MTAVKIYICFIVIAASLILNGCSKKKFLNEKPGSNILVPNTLVELQNLLDNDQVFNHSPLLGELSADNYYLRSVVWSAVTVKEQNSYIWEADIFKGEGKVEDYNVPYIQIFTANIVLEGLNKIEISNSNEQDWKLIKGWALFFRGVAFYNLAQLFAAVYDSTNADKKPGIPLKLNSNIDEKTVRSSIELTYKQILSDLTDASQLLPEQVFVNNRNRPCKVAADAMLAKIYLSMGAYAQAAQYANSSLLQYHNLINYDTISATSNFPFLHLNQETIWQSLFTDNTSIFLSTAAGPCLVDTLLYRSYQPDDLRKSIFFRNTINGFTMKGSYTGLIFPFGGIATDEVYLIRAESYARLGNITAAMNDLNELLKNRWKKGTFVPFTANTQEDAINIILEERRKELPFRGTRWTDLRRLNREGRVVTLRRILNGVEYKLLPNTDRYTLPIPPDVIEKTGIPQNPR